MLCEAPTTICTLKWPAFRLKRSSRSSYAIAFALPLVIMTLLLSISWCHTLLCLGLPPCVPFMDGAIRLSKGYIKSLKSFFLSIFPLPMSLFGPIPFNHFSAQWYRFLRILNALPVVFTTSCSSWSYCGGPDYSCVHYGVVFWYGERVRQNNAFTYRRIAYNACCRGGKLVFTSI